MNPLSGPNLAGDDSRSLIAAETDIFASADRRAVYTQFTSVVFCLWPMSPNRKRPVWFLLTQHWLSPPGGWPSICPLGRLSQLTVRNCVLSRHSFEPEASLRGECALDSIAYQRAYQAGRTRILRHFGLCVACGKAEAQKGRTRCRRCAFNASERTKKWLRKRTTISITRNSPPLFLRGGSQKSLPSAKVRSL